MKYSKLDAVAEALDNNEDYRLVGLYNEMVGYDSPFHIWEMGNDFNEVFESFTPLGIAKLVKNAGNEFNPAAKWFVYDGENVKTFSLLGSHNSPFDNYEIAEWLLSKDGEDFVEDFVAESDLEDSFLDCVLPMDYDEGKERLDDYRESHEGFTLLKADWNELVEKLRGCR